MTTTLLNDQTATDHILNAACTTAVAFIRDGRPDRAETALKAAGLSAAMLLGEGPA